MAIPSTLHDSLMARLDRLPSAKEVAQIGAVIGREFGYRVLAAVTGSPKDALHSALDQLVAAELLFRRGEHPDAIFSFKHALVQDAAYQSLLRRRRQDLHARTAIALEEQFPEVAKAEPELVANHCAQGGLPEKAVDYWQKAARHASERSSNLEAIRHLNKALEVLATLPEGPERAHRELTTVLAMGVSLHDVEGPASAKSVEVYERACALSEKAGESLERFAALWGLWRSRLWRGDISLAKGLVEDLVGLAERESNRALLLQARHAQWSTTQLSGNLIETLDWARSGLALYDPAASRSEIYRLSGHDPAVCGCATLAQALWLLGYPDQAAEKIEDALGLARQLTHASSLANGLINAVDLQLLRGDAVPLRELAEQLIALATEHGFAGYLDRGKFARGWAMSWRTKATKELP
jgi:tetratricopeptide (TPR) repeat protein